MKNKLPFGLICEVFYFASMLTAYVQNNCEDKTMNGVLKLLREIASGDITLFDSPYDPTNSINSQVGINYMVNHEKYLAEKIISEMDRRPSD